MLLLVEDEQVGEEEESKWDEGVVVKVGPQEGKAAHLHRSVESSEMKREIDPKEEGGEEERKLESSFCPTSSKIKPARLNSHSLKLAQPQRADQAGWKEGMGEVGIRWFHLVASDDVAEIAGSEGVQLP